MQSWTGTAEPSWKRLKPSNLESMQDAFEKVEDVVEGLGTNTIKDKVVEVTAAEAQCSALAAPAVSPAPMSIEDARAAEESASVLSLQLPRVAAR